MREDFPLALTFDIDWAPDFVIAECVEILDNYRIPATFFATHPSAVLSSLGGNDQFEIGIHPNFLNHSSHGSNIEEIMNYVLALAPSAQSMRTHSLFQHSLLFSYIIEHFKQIKFDFSLFLPGNTSCIPFKFQNDLGSHSLIRTPYQWEDDCFFSLEPKKKLVDNILFKTAKYQILNFHPIHIYLNSSCGKQYQLMKQNLKKSLHRATHSDIQNFINHKQGVKNWLNAVIENTNPNRFVLCSKIAKDFILENQH